MRYLRLVSYSPIEYVLVFATTRQGTITGHGHESTNTMVLKQNTCYTSDRYLIHLTCLLMIRGDFHFSRLALTTISNTHMMFTT